MNQRSVPNLPPRSRAVAGLLLALGVVLSGCTGSDDDGTDAGPATTTNSSVPTSGGIIISPVDTGGDTLDVASDQCSLFTGDEVEAVIGPHDGGQQDFQLGGCVWTAGAADSGGYTPRVQATVADQGIYEAVAEPGDPVDGFGDGATYDTIYGELWFPCANGQWCGVKADLADGDERRTATLALGTLLRDRA